MFIVSREFFKYSFSVYRVPEDFKCRFSVYRVSGVFLIEDSVFIVTREIFKCRFGVYRTPGLKFYYTVHVQLVFQYTTVGHPKLWRFK